MFFGLKMNSTNYIVNRKRKRSKSETTVDKDGASEAEKMPV